VVYIIRRSHLVTIIRSHLRPSRKTWGVFLFDGSGFVTIDSDRVEFRESSTGRRMGTAIRPKAMVD